MPSTAESLGLRPPSTADSLGLKPPSRPGVGGPSDRATALRETITGTGVGQKQAFESVEVITKRLRDAGKTDAEIEADPDLQTAAKAQNRAVMQGGSSTAIGAAGGDIGGAVLARALPAAKTAIQSFAPKLGAIGEAATVSPLGDIIRKSATDRLGKLSEGQAAQFERALESHGIDIYADKAATLPARVFRDRDTVALMKRLAGNDPWLENQAGVYAATRLKEITAGTGPLQTHASRAAAWAARNADWINEFPQVKQAVDSYIGGLRRTAVAKGVGALGAGTAAASLGVPWWLRKITDFLP